MAAAMRSERLWSTAAHTDTVAYQSVIILKKRGAQLTLPLLDLGALDVLEVASDIVHVRIPLLVIPDLGPESAWLLEVD